MNPTSPTRLSDHTSQYEQDDFIVEISFFDEFDEDDENELFRESHEKPLLH
ncbi:MAG: hypothetical protein WEB57_10730 [Pseudohongiellaceae bacterium]